MDVDREMEMFKAVGRMEGKLDTGLEQMQRVEDKIDGHLNTPHADPNDVKALLRFRWMFAGAVALMSAAATLAALL